MSEQERLEMGATEPAQSDTQEQVPKGELSQPLSVPQALLFSISLFAELAWQKLGLHPDPVTKQIAADLPQAKVAIDAVAALVELAKGQVGEREYRELRTLLANLQLNFVYQSQRQQPSSNSSTGEESVS